MALSGSQTTHLALDGSPGRARTFTAKTAAAPPPEYIQFLEETLTAPSLDAGVFTVPGFDSETLDQ